jgi:hypothetical protein
MFFASLNAYKKTPIAKEAQVRAYFNQVGTKVRKKPSKKGSFKTTRFTFGRQSIAVAMALKSLRREGVKITNARIASLASRIVRNATKAIGYFKSGWVDIGKRAARRGGKGLYPFGLGKVPFIKGRRNKTQVSLATNSRKSAEIVYRFRARPTGTKKRRTFILPEVVQAFRSGFARAANTEIDKTKSLIRQTARRLGL